MEYFLLRTFREDRVEIITMYPSLYYETHEIQSPYIKIQKTQKH